MQDLIREYEAQEKILNAKIRQLTKRLYACQGNLNEQLKIKEKREMYYQMLVDVQHSLTCMRRNVAPVLPAKYNPYTFAFCGKW